MATSTPASANSPANISPVGPPPATTTACSATRHPHPRRFWFLPEILQPDPGLAASGARRLASVPDDAMARVADADRVVGVGERLVVATGPLGDTPEPIHRAAGLGEARRDLRLDVCCDAARDRRRRREKIAGPAGG